jgi:hypothetical protein
MTMQKLERHMHARRNPLGAFGSYGSSGGSGVAAVADGGCKLWWWWWRVVVVVVVVAVVVVAAEGGGGCDGESTHLCMGLRSESLP